MLKLHGELRAPKYGVPHLFLIRWMNTYMHRFEETTSNFPGLIQEKN